MTFAHKIVSASFQNTFTEANPKSRSLQFGGVNTWVNMQL